jgi:hypothetical protein
MFHICLHASHGPGHVGTSSWRNFIACSNDECRTLHFHAACTPCHQLLVPALLQHWCKLKHVHCVNQQWDSCSAARVPDFKSLWEKIAMGEPWESPPPSQVLDLPSPFPNALVLHQPRPGQALLIPRRVSFHPRTDSQDHSTSSAFRATQQKHQDQVQHHINAANCH